MMTLILDNISFVEAFRSYSMVTMLLVVAVVIAFVIVFVSNRIIVRRVRKTTAHTQEVSGIMQRALVLGRIHVLHFMPSTRTIRQVRGSVLSQEKLSFEEFFGLLHPEDRAVFNSFLQRLCSKGAEADECSFRLNMSADENHEDWHFLHCHAITEARKYPVNIICTLTDETESMAEQRNEQELTEKYRIIFDQSFVGLAFYDKNGMLLAANKPMRELVHFQGENDPFFFNTSMFDMPVYRDLIDRRHVEPVFANTRCIIPERHVNTHVSVRINPILDDKGQLLYISVAARDVSEERSLYLAGIQNDAEMKKANKEIQQYEGELQYLMDNCDMRVWRTSYVKREIYFYKSLSEYEKKMNFEELLAFFIDEDGNVARKLNDPETNFSKPVSYLCHMHSVFHDTDELQWNMIDSIPVFDSNGKLEGSFGTIRNMTALIEAQEHLKEETRRANDSGRLKSVFMANMTHEIRTPLNSIVGFSDLLPMMDSPEDKQQMVQVIRNNCDMLLRLINDILEVSTMDSQAIVLNPVDADFSVEFDTICQSLAERVQEPSVEFICDHPNEPLPVHLDILRVQQVITNFVTNAVKYTHQGHIRVGYRKEQGMVTGADGNTPVEGLYIYCEDTGAGIPKEKQASVFERFVKLNDFVQGTGLGLSICKTIADKSGGKIGVESEGENQGSTFWIWLPLSSK